MFSILGYGMLEENDNLGFNLNKSNPCQTSYHTEHRVHDPRAGALYLHPPTNAIGGIGGGSLDLSVFV
jgi:hypothetical protein